MKHACSGTSPYTFAARNTYATRMHPTIVVHRRSMPLRPARKIDAALNALAAISEGFITAGSSARKQSNLTRLRGLYPFLRSGLDMNCCEVDMKTLRLLLALMFVPSTAIAQVTN